MSSKHQNLKKPCTFYKEGVKENKRSFIVSMLSAVVWCFLIVIQPYIIKRIIDEGIVEPKSTNINRINFVHVNYWIHTSNNNWGTKVLLNACLIQRRSWN